MANEANIPIREPPYTKRKRSYSACPEQIVSPIWIVTPEAFTISAKTHLDIAEYFAKYKSINFNCTIHYWTEVWTRGVIELARLWLAAYQPAITRSLNNANVTRGDFQNAILRQINSCFEQMKGPEKESGWRTEWRWEVARKQDGDVLGHHHWRYKQCLLIDCELTALMYIYDGSTGLQLRPRDLRKVRHLCVRRWMMRMPFLEKMLVENKGNGPLRSPKLEVMTEIERILTEYGAWSRGFEADLAFQWDLVKRREKGKGRSETWHPLPSQEIGEGKLSSSSSSSSDTLE